jgi:tetratricopeptide (TPR) repeat protein
MLVNLTLFIIITFVLMFSLLMLTNSPVIAGAITMVTVMAGYIVISVIRSRKRIHLLEEKCDPQAFIEATEKQMKLTGKNPKVKAYLNIDKAAGLIVLGEFQKAKEVLSSVDKSYLSARNGSLLIYKINMISCSYELGEIPFAEELFETQLLPQRSANVQIAKAMEFLDAERLFFLNKFEESRQKFQKLINEKTSKRKRVEILYRLALIDDINGDTESAKQKYKEVADNGGGLWSASQARKRLDTI